MTLVSRGLGVDGIGLGSAQCWESCRGALEAAREPVKLGRYGDKDFPVAAFSVAYIQPFQQQEELVEAATGQASGRQATDTQEEAAAGAHRPDPFALRS